MAKLSRRHFLKSSSYLFGSTVVSSGLTTMLTACSGDDNNSTPADFNHGVASGDPLHDRVIIWTRVTPEDTNAEKVNVFWEVSSTEDFSGLVVSGSGTAESHRDFTLKVDVIGLSPGTQYFYRFLTSNNTSPVGKTKTLPQDSIDEVNLAVLSCSNYPAGFFHVYKEVANKTNIDAAIHLGDYIYEYGREGYASEDAASMGREVQPTGELITLDDYRARYAQYRADPDLQAFHQALPLIAVWDDHEVANDSWKDGAENHDEDTQGYFLERLAAALQAYAEWMPIRPPVDTEVDSLYRSFQFGDLVNLMMLDTRIVGRDQQLSMVNYFSGDGGFDLERYQIDVNDPNRTLLGVDQRQWLTSQLSNNATWHVLGQQVLMGTMTLPGAVATAQLSLAEFSELAQIAQLAQSNPSSLTPEQLTRLEQQGPLLQLPNLPYNLDAWDGYPYERNQILLESFNQQKNLVVLAGDTHNAWATNIDVDNATATNKPAAVEFATSSVSSPGLEDYLGLDSEIAIAQTEAGLTGLIQNLQYTNLSDRGFLVVSFQRDQAEAKWQFVSSVKEAQYQLLNEREKTIVVQAGSNYIEQTDA